MNPNVDVQTIVSRPFEQNSYVVWPAGGTEGVVIDPGLEPDLILDFLRDEGLTPAAVLNTHGHADHIAGNAALKAAFPAAPLLIGADEAFDPADPNTLYAAAVGNRRVPGGVYETKDAGAHWTIDLHAVNGDWFGHVAIAPSHPSTLYAMSARHLYRSGDAGKSWSPAGAGLPATKDGHLLVGSLSVSPAASHTVYVGGRGLWRSLDGGRHWARWGRGLAVPDVLGIVAGDRVYTSTTGAGVWERDALP